MSILARLSSSRYLPALFFALTLVPAAGLVWLGWQLLEQDRVLEVQRATERRELAADRIVNSLQQELMSIRETLVGADPGPVAATEDSVVVVFHQDEVEIDPPGRLLFQPVVQIGKEPPEKPYVTGERFEFQRRDYARAIAAFEKLTNSSDRAICAGAVLRIARNHRKAGNLELAMEAYEQLGRFTGISFEGVPAELVGRRTRCELLAEMEQAPALMKEARSLDADLAGGRWRLTRPIFQLYTIQVRNWLGPAEDCLQARLALSSTVEWLWKQWQESLTGGWPVPQSVTHTSNAHAFTILLRTTGELAVALVAGPEFVERTWLSQVVKSPDARAFNVYLRDSEGKRVAGTLLDEMDQASLRLPADTGLPWTVMISEQADPADKVRFSSRRRLVLSGLALVLVLFVVSSYLVGRAFSRELSVARLKSDFVAAVSHEFRTPLATLQQLTENLLEGRVAGGERLSAYYHAQARATGRLTRLVERLLDFGRMEAGAFRYRPERVRLDELTRSVVDEFEHISATTGHEIELSADPTLEPVLVDREAMAQAIWNLLDNAIKYSPDGSTVWVDVSREQGNAAVRVRDEGPGIAEDEQKDLLQKFVRGSAARKGAIKGTGIGLAMVDHIVRAHRGCIRVDSNLGEGSTFTILLRREQ